MPIFALIIAYSLEFSKHLKNIINKENKKYLINILIIFIFLLFVQIYLLIFLITKTFSGIDGKLFS